MNPTKIGITLRITHAEKYDEKRDSLSQEWTNLLDTLNMIPIFIPNTLKDVKSFLMKLNVDGLILSGGDNIGDHIERDDTEKNIIEFAIKKRIPVFGVCRGMQVLNNYFGGSMKQLANSSHVGKRHKIKFLSFFSSNSIEVNSFHHNIITHDKVGNDLEAFAVDINDKTVEGFVHKQLPIIGVMWHPERESNSFNKDLLKQTFQEKFFWEG